VARPDGPAKVLAISEEWSSDCRRDIPLLARLADTVGLELRIFTRDGPTFGRGPKPEPDSPNAVYHKDRLRASLGAPAPGETPEQAKARGDKAFAEMLGSPFFDVWRAAALAEWTSMLYERMRVGSLA
jgi:hypothetical protein